jgi:hypothetical protein
MQASDPVKEVDYRKEISTNSGVLKIQLTPLRAYFRIGSR